MFRSRAKAPNGVVVLVVIIVVILIAYLAFPHKTEHFFHEVIDAIRYVVRHIVRFFRNL